MFASLTRNLTNLTKRWSQIHKGCQCQLRQFTSRSHILHIPSVIKRGNGKSCIYNRYIIVDFPTKTPIDRGFSNPPRLTTGGDSDYIMCVQKVNLTRDGKWIHSNDKKSKGITISLSLTWQLVFFMRKSSTNADVRGGCSWLLMDSQIFIATALLNFEITRVCQLTTLKMNPKHDPADIWQHHQHHPS